MPHAGLTRHTLRPVSAWLLRTNRRFHPGGRRTLAEFGRSFATADGATGTGKWTVSRWETGSVPVPYQAVRGYEQVLDLRPGSLAAVLDTVNRYLAPRLSSPPALARPATALSTAKHERLAAVVDKVHTGTVVTGMEWDELTHFLSVTPDAVLPRPGTWTELAERLLAETVVADGVPWMLRFEAFNRLLSHPVGQRAAVAACADLAADRTNQVFVDPVSALDGSAHPDASRAVVRQLTEPTNDRAFYGALLACIRKSRYGHFTERQAGQVGDVLRALARDRRSDRETRRLVAGVLRNLYGPSGPGTAGSGRPLEDEQHKLMTSRLRNSVAAPGQDGPDVADEVLPGLLHALLFHPLADIRLDAALVVAASPYARPVADALVRELSRSLALGQTGLALALVDALRVLGGPGQARALQALVVRPDPPTPVRRQAAYWLGHLGLPATDPFWAKAVSHHLNRWTSRGDETSGSLLADLVYSLGIAGDDHLLRRLHQADAPARARTAAGWWLRIPTAVRQSARL